MDTLPFRNTKGYYKKDPRHYFKVHAWIKKHKPLPKECEHCYKEKRLDYANLSQDYLFEIDDWACLCRRCHTRIDVINSATGKKMRFYDIYIWEFALNNERLVRSSLKRKLSKAARNVDRDINIFYRWVIEEDTYAAMGRDHNLSVERVRQIVSKLLNITSKIKIRKKKNDNY